MARIHFTCPRCGAETEIQLESNASLLLLSCGQCRCPLMYFAGQAFEIDESEFTHLQGKQMKAVEGFLKLHKNHTASVAASGPSQALPVTHKAGEPIRDYAIAPDDITDLIIDLQTCEDVDDFLKRLG